MYVVLCHPTLRLKGGAERAVFEIAKKFNPIIYIADSPDALGYPEFREFEIRQLPKSSLEPFFPLFRNNWRMLLLLQLLTKKIYAFALNMLRFSCFR